MLIVRLVQCTLPVFTRVICAGSLSCESSSKGSVFVGEGRFAEVKGEEISRFVF